MIAVLDTNVLVSALLSPFQAPGRFLDLILAGEITVAFDDRVLAEYREVLARPRFTFDERVVQEVIGYFEQSGMAVVASMLGASLPDPDDSMFLEVAAAAQATLVSGNLRHYPPDRCHGVMVLSPGAFLERLHAKE